MHLSSVRSPHGDASGNICIQVSNTSTSAKKIEIQVAQVEPNQITELEFTDQESNEAIKLFGCDCPVCINAVRQLHGVAPLPI